MFGQGMAYPAYIRDKARKLRVEKKLTIDELADRLAVSRTTVYYWVSDLPIGPTEKQTLAAYRAGQVTRRIHRVRRAVAYEQGRCEYATLLKETTFRDFVCMYIGEGYKRNRNVVSICNSDPRVIRLGAIWISRLASNPVTFSFQHHVDQDPDKLCAFWGDLLGVEPSAIRFQRKSNSGRLKSRIWRSKYGVLQVRTADTYLRARLQAWMDCIRAEWP
jgi:DNA-binding XRE family transcriptional regulator